MYAYEFLRYHGLEVPNFRSSELWEDQKFTCVSMNLKPLDLILLNSAEQAWGAHVVIYLGQQLILHLSKENKLPKVEYLGDLQKNPKYRCYWSKNCD